jgi:choline dehydrogenase-like flavoprotein
MDWDAIVIGSGIGGLTAAAALARCDQRVLVLEQHFALGGMTQTFERQGFRFGTGLHYIGGVGPQSGAAGSFGRLLGWLGDGSLQFAPLPKHFDTVRLSDPSQPGGEFSLQLRRPGVGQHHAPEGAVPRRSGRAAPLRAGFPQSHPRRDASLPPAWPAQAGRHADGLGARRCAA